MKEGQLVRLWSLQVTPMARLWLLLIGWMWEGNFDVSEPSHRGDGAEV